ncbi:CCR4-NOT transcription complex subunit 10 [Acipenser ruthenus]|uniref:CCR4-NOT transcription complex subunit 10 n=1 Tax=Acipenser ruthenus TaxID=7906 RepID=A0A444V7U0_ACIRT|nr:CCR4-NOT transcription complex subunit 10 [Acipenser ruthenus]
MMDMMDHDSIKSGNYDTCLQHLTSLQEVNKDDYKIAMNKAIAEFYKSGQTTTVTLKQILAAMKKQVHAAVEEIDGLDDVENSFLYYNQAIIHYHMRQYTEAITIGEKLYQFLEPFEEKFAQAVCFLLVDLYLLTFQPEKALHLIAVLEKLTIQGNNKNGKNEYKVRAYIQMKSLKTCKREIKSVMNTAGNTSEQETKGLPSKKGIVQSIVGQGYHRKIILASQSTQNTVYNDGQSAAIPVASMEFAAICLRNALLLLPEDQQEAKSENGSKNSSQSGSVESSSEGSEACSGKGHEGDKFIPSPPSSPLRKQELENLRCSILACSAYVALTLGDSLLALNHAEKLLQQLKLSGSLKFLGHLYAAEALISLDRISDAISHLNPENVTDVSLGISSNEQDQGSDKGENEPMESSGKQTPLCYPNSVMAARAMMLFNLGSAYCLRSEYEKARKCLHQAASMVQTKEIPPEAILLAVYLELQNGNTQLALQIIKRNQLLPSVKTLSPDVRKKPAAFQPVQPIQPIQMPAFTTVQRK